MRLAAIRATLCVLKLAEVPGPKSSQGTRDLRKRIPAPTAASALRSRAPEKGIECTAYVGSRLDTYNLRQANHES